MILRTWWPFLLAALFPLLLGCNSTPNAGNADSADSSEQLVENVEATLQEMKAYSFDLDVSMEVTAQGVEQKMDSQYDVKIEKPDRWAILLESGMMGGTSVSDGKNLTKYSQMLQKYSVEPLSEGQEMETSQVGLSQSYMMLGAAGFSRLFMGEGLKDWLLDGVSNSEFAENKMIDGKTCRVATFQQENGMHWEIAVATGPRPLVRQFVLEPDFSKLAEQQSGMPKGMKMKVTLNFTDWQTDAQFDEDDFVFTPPSGAKKVESLFAQLGGEEQLHSLVGEQAPSFSAMDLDGQTVELDQFAGEDVVILDFWATWCGPCVDALPIIAKVAKEFQDKHVSFYAVNQGESPDTIREFLSSEDLDVPVLLDEEGSIGKLFQVSGIPQTVLIDKEGRVQVVHVGFGGNLEKQLTKELEDILAGKDLATASVEKQEKASEQAAPVEATGMALVWTREGQFSDVAVDADSGNVFALNRGGDIAVITTSGDLLRTVPLPDAGNLLRSGTLVGDKAADLITFGPWGNTLNAYSQSGELLWTKSEQSGIDDVQLADLFEDGTDDVIIGFNGAGGLTVLDNQGQELWNNSSIGNVWHVTAGKFTQENVMQVISTSAKGQVHVFDLEGKSVKNFKVSLYANGIRYKPATSGSPAGVVVTGSTDEREAMLLLDVAGEEKWKIDLPMGETKHIDSIVIDPNGKFSAVGARGGWVHVVDLAVGKIVASVGQQGLSPQVALLETEGDEPLIIVATGQAVNAYRLTESEVE